MHYPAKSVTWEVLRHNNTPRSGNWRHNSTRATVKKQVRSERIDTHSTLFAALSMSGAPVPRLFALSPPSGQGAVRGMRCSGNKRYNKQEIYVPDTINHFTVSENLSLECCCVCSVCSFFFFEMSKCRGNRQAPHVVAQNDTCQFFSLLGVSDRGVPFSRLPDSSTRESIPIPAFLRL